MARFSLANGFMLHGSMDIFVSVQTAKTAMCPSQRMKIAPKSTVTRSYAESAKAKRMHSRRFVVSDGSSHAWRRRDLLSLFKSARRSNYELRLEHYLPARHGGFTNAR